MAMKFEKLEDGNYLLNVTGYSCPHPQMYTKKALQKLESGTILVLIFDNASSGESIASMCETDGNDLLEQANDAGTFTWKIRKG